MKEYSALCRLDTLLSAIQKDFAKYPIEIGNGICMYDRFIGLLNSGRKKTSIRYSKRAIRVPCASEANLFETMENDKDHRKYVGTVSIEKIVIKRFRELTEEDALNDGFRRKDDLIRFLNETYGKIAPMAPLVIYHIRKK